MNKILGVILGLVSIPAFAYEYNCSSIDENFPYGIKKIELKVDQSFVEMKFHNFDQVEIYAISDYQPARSIPKRSMIRMDLITPAKNSYGESPLYEFFGDKELVTGGYRLKIGKLGGFIKVSGQGYSWAKYICSRRH
ncbi:MAG: hypothetical protein AB7I27_12720 [Bacteriovoracaceae bacterium]